MESIQTERKTRAMLLRTGRCVERFSHCKRLRLFSTGVTESLLCGQQIVSRAIDWIRPLVDPMLRTPHFNSKDSCTIAMIEFYRSTIWGWSRLWESDQGKHVPIFLDFRTWNFDDTELTASRDAEIVFKYNICVRDINFSSCSGSYAPRLKHHLAFVSFYLSIDCACLWRARAHVSYHGCLTERPYSPFVLS